LAWWDAALLVFGICLAALAGESARDEFLCHGEPLRELYDEIMESKTPFRMEGVF
jgi:hypothetical protein